MKIEAVIICVNYSDFLAHTLPGNRTLFDKVVVVTTKEDIDTQNLCNYLHVKCVTTDVFYSDGDTFNKGKAINVGLKHLDCDGWVVQLDADIYLPPMTRIVLEKIELDSKTIYGIDRLMCPNYASWMKFISKPKFIHEAYIYIHLDCFPVGVRIAEYMNKGYEPIGYFQMWNPIGSNVLTYPTSHGKADRTDVLHAKKFSRKK